MNPLEMTDEDFSKITSSEALEELAKKEDESEDNESKSEETSEPTDKEEDSVSEESEKQEAEDKPIEEEDKKPTEPKEETKVFDSGSEDQVTNKKEDTSSELDKKEDTISSNETNSNDSKSIDYKSFYEKVMAPLKANGKTIQLRSPEEAIQLMQMGANYTKKMQAIAPYRKIITMLESQQLLDEDKLTFLIDLNKKNPEAIKKLIKDANLDPLEIDVSEEPKYQAGNYRVTDAEVNFKSVLDDLRTTEEGMNTIRTINNTWDDQSKNILWESPEIMRTINEQQRSGVYKLIVDEMDRRKMLGQIPSGMPFLQAYKLVGDSLLQERQKSLQTSQARQPLATKVMTKTSVENNSKVKSASLPRTTPKAVKKFINPLSMSDEDFLKQMANRL